MANSKESGVFRVVSQEAVGEIPFGVNNMTGRRVFDRPGFFPNPKNLKEVRQRGKIRSVADKLRRVGKSVSIVGEMGRVVLFIKSKMPGGTTRNRERNTRVKK